MTVKTNFLDFVKKPAPDINGNLPNPQPCEPLTDIDHIDLEGTKGLNRRLDCTKYDFCLAVACDGAWRSFRCDECETYQEMSEDQKMLEGLHILAHVRGSEDQA